MYTYMYVISEAAIATHRHSATLSPTGVTCRLVLEFY